MDCKIKNGKPDINPIKLVRNSGDIKKRTVKWKSLDGTYVLQVPAGVFEGLDDPDDCLLLINHKKTELVLAKTDANLGPHDYVIDGSDSLQSDTPPEIIVSDEGSQIKPKRRTPGKPRKPGAKRLTPKPPAEKPD
jgi:hypothetical protein